ncbi:MAG TPA: hypothetical protein VHC22_16300 [Pirellulales bacterium]|nr:hypothetical protein [Pirellulales bacterium]
MSTKTAIVHPATDDGRRLAAPEIYSTLAKHQRDETWHGRELVAELQT